MTINEKVKSFCAIFERQRDVISKINVDWESLPGSAVEDYKVRLYRKILLVACLDTLAGIRFSKKHYPSLSNSNRERFIRFVKEHADWREGDLVSIQFLTNKLNEYGLTKGKLSGYIRHKLANFDPNTGGSLKISKIDEPIDGLINLATTEKEEKAIFEVQHFSLLYRYRNYLVHEFREPGGSMELDSLSTEPYYHGYIKDPKWYLVYPMQLFYDLFQNSVKRFEEYLLIHSIDPYLLVEESHVW
jgi:hypothetical protein